MASQIQPDKSRKYRVCFAGCWLNAITVPYNFPIPSTHPPFAKDHSVFSSVDVKHAFLHLLLDEGSQLLTTFYWNGNYYYFTRAILGTLNVSAHYQSVMQDILDGAVKSPSVACPYIDDTNIGSVSLIDHSGDLRSVISRFTENGLRISIPK